MSARAIFAAVILAALSFGSAPTQAQTAPHGYTLECAPVRKVSKGHVLFDCTLQAVHAARPAGNAFGSWRYGDPMPHAEFTQVVGNGGPYLPITFGSKATVAADGGNTTITFTQPFLVSIGPILVTPASYSGTDNAAVSCRIISESLSNFVASCSGGQTGSTVTLYYGVNGL